MPYDCLALLSGEVVELYFTKCNYSLLILSLRLRKLECTNVKFENGVLVLNLPA